MGRLFARLVILIFLFSTSALLSQTKVDTVYGPKKFVKNKGTYTFYNETFTVNVKQGATFRLLLNTGDDKWRTRLTSGYIKLNGKIVVNFLGLNPLVHSFNKAVTLTANNSLEIKLYGLQGAYITLSFLEYSTQNDITSPVLVITNPVEGLLTNQPNLTIQGKVTDQSPATLTLNGSSVQIASDGTFTKSYTLTEGANTLSFIAADSYGNKTTVSRIVTLDTTPPVLVITSPADGLITKQSSVNVTGSISNYSGNDKVKINGIAVPLGQTGGFSSNVNLQEGSNKVDITAEDIAGNITQVKREVIQDNIAPVLSISSPNDSLLTNKPNITISGTVADSTEVSLKLNGNIVNLSGSAFTLPTALTEGINIISITAIDRAGNQTEKIIIATLDTVMPSAEIINPIDSLVINISTITLNGKVNNFTNEIVELNGDLVPVSSQGEFTSTVSLVEGWNTFNISVVDKAGNELRLKRIIKLDSKAPDLVLVTPIDGLVTRDSNLELKGTVTDDSKTVLQINGNNIDPVGTSFISNLLLIEGTNRFTITAEDEAHNKFEKVIKVICDKTAPKIVITSPEEGVKVNTLNIIITGTVEDSTKVTVSVNGSNLSEAVQNGTYSTEVNLAEGSNLITLTAVDEAGNTSICSRNINYEKLNLPPDPEIIAPKPDPTVATTVFTATEFIYKGNNPIQYGVKDSTIEPKKVCLIRGKVLDYTNKPLPAVKVTILNHPEYGYTLSRLDGFFDMAVNGGNYLTVNYQKENYLSIQRQVNAEWQDYAIIDSIVMMKLDQNVTTVDFKDTIEVAKGSIVTDKDGTRQATIMFRQGTIAKMFSANGDTVSLPSINVRATEYTVDPLGPSAMPAALPPTSGYTYCVELSIDEAVQAGAKGVMFNKPVSFYVDNFLKFPVGISVPVGYYDREKGVWIPCRDGKVIKVVSISNGLADIDISGDEIAENPTQLLAIGIDDVERRKLSTNLPGTSLWRVQLNHFSPIDLNYPIGPPADAILPNQKIKKADTDETNDESPLCGSLIGAQKQTLGETYKISGTPFSLYYRNDRTEGFLSKYSLEIPLIGAVIPSSLKNITLEIYIAGNKFVKTFNPTPGQTYKFLWDGKDIYNNTVQGMLHATVRIGYTYGANYMKPNDLGSFASFAERSGVVLYQNPARQDVTLWQETKHLLGTFDTKELKIGSWSINVHHNFEPLNSILHYGYAEDRSVSSDFSDKISKNNIICTLPNSVIFTNDTLYLSNGQIVPWLLPAAYYDMAVGPDETVYLTNNYKRSLVYFIKKNGEAGIFAGKDRTSQLGYGYNYGYNGDSIKANQALLCNPHGIDVGTDGSIYIAEYGGNRIRKIDKNGIITTVAGNGSQGFSGDGGLATKASLNRPNCLCVDKNNNIYFVDEENYRIRKITNGIITTIAGTGIYGCSNEIKPAIESQIPEVGSIAVSDDGKIYVTLLISNGSMVPIKFIDNKGMFIPFAGGGRIYRGNEIPALQASFYSPGGLSICKDGSVIFTEGNIYEGRVLRHVDVYGNIHLLAGSRNPNGYEYEGVPALGAITGYMGETAVLPDGEVYVTTASSNPCPFYNVNDINYPDQPSRVKKISNCFPKFSNTCFSVASEDGSEYYTFNALGKHLKTNDAITNVIKYSFEYDSLGTLSSIIDKDSLITTIERNIYGDATAIVSPFGQKTYLSINSRGYLSSIKNPNNDSTQFEYSDLGLMTKEIDAKGNTHFFTYDSLGCLIKDEDPAGGYKALTKTEVQNGSEIQVKTAEGRVTKYKTESFGTSEKRYTSTGQDGLSTIKSVKPDGTTTITLPDGTIKTTVDFPDPQFGMQAPITSRITITTPAKLIMTINNKRTITQRIGDKVTGLIDSNKVNGNIFISKYDGNQNLSSTTSPLGRKTFTFTDTSGRVVKDSIVGLVPTNYNYNQYGFLSKVSRGGRKSLFGYDDKGNLASVTDPLNRTEHYYYDLAGRVTKQVLNDGREINYTYDANGNLTSLTPPGRPAHSFDYTSVDLTNSYNPAVTTDSAGIIRYEYNKDKQLTKINRPDGTSIIVDYDTTGCGCSGAGKPKRILFDRGEIDYSYDSKTGNLSSISAPSGNSMTFTFDGSLPITVNYFGSISGNITCTYDNFFRVKSQSINNSNPIDFGYDKDGLLTRAGLLRMGYGKNNGLYLGDTLGNLTGSYTYNNLGEVTSYTAQYGSNELFKTEYQYDSLSRITQIREMEDGRWKKLNYKYDTYGYLTEVQRNDTTISQYEYDANGNRTARTLVCEGTARIDSGYYDSQDRMLKYGNTSYVYTRNGELLKKISGTDTTKYTYDVFGNLLKVVINDSTTIEYLIDAQNRRIAKLLNGSIVKRWLYSGGLTPVAELDSAGNVVTRFAGGYFVKHDTTYRIITDHLGSVRQVINTATGTIVQRIDYDEYGNVMYDSNPDFQPLAYAGGMYDNQTKLVRFGARDYDASTGRWTCEDPIGFDGGLSNLYEYVANDPINNIDPAGKQIISPILAGSGSIWVTAGNSSTIITAGNGSKFFRPFVEQTARLGKNIKRTIPKETPTRYVEPVQQFMKQPEIPKTWWGRLIDKVGDLLSEMGFGNSSGVTIKHKTDTKNNPKGKSCNSLSWDGGWI